ncbi:SusC/RagA family TonB-linked outer membrane protein [Larkinella arboricola]
MKQFYAFLLVWLVVGGLGRAWAQDRTLSGKITSSTDGSPLPGVNVVAKGSSKGSVSDADGNYTLAAPAGTKTLVFSYIGFLTQEAPVPASSNTVNIAMTEAAQSLDEVIVSGLATSVKRSNAANAVARITADELVGKTRPVTLDAAMSGKIVGANIVQNSGAPGGGISVKLRGISSINGSSEPLYVVDGVFVNNSQFATGAGSGSFSGAGTNQDQAPNRISDINPADIESMEILKGPSAAAIYGTRANAGVIIITTKKGKAGKTKVSFGQDIGFSSAIRLLGSEGWSLDPIGPEGQNKFDYVFGNGTPGSGSKTEIELWQKATAEGKIYDYEKYIYGNTGHISNTRLSVSGGNDKTKFYFAAGLNDETGIQKGTGFQRKSIRLNVDHKLAKWIDFSIGSNYMRTGAQRSFSGNDNRGVSIGYTLAYTPNYAQLFPVNGVYPLSRYTGDSPIAIAERTINDEMTNRFIQSFTSNVYFLQKPNSTLKLALQGGLDYVNTEAEVYFPEDLQSQLTRATPGASRYSKNRSFNTNLQAFLIYNWQLAGGKIDLTSQVGAVRLTTDNDFSWIQGDGLLPKQKNPNTGSVRTFNETWQAWQDVGLVAQQEANYQDKIIGTLGIRFDKSSLNGDNQKWYSFPRASLAVNVAKFDFWSYDPISQLKLRGAFGRTGGVPAYGNIFTSLGTTIIDGQLGSVVPTTVGNPTIEPETAQEIEWGIDLGFLKNRIALEATYYDKQIFNLLNPYTLSSGTGVTQFNAYPVGDLQNRGIELGLNLVPVEMSNFTWTSSVQYWFNRSKITRLEIPNTTVGSGFSIYGRNQLRLGESPTRWFGSPNVPDENGVAQATRYEDAQPRYQISFSNQIKLFQHFDFGFLLHTSQGNFNSNLTTKQKDTGGTTVDWSQVDNLYGNVGLPNGRARLPTNPNVTAREFIQDASYVRLREVSLYYTLPKTLLTRAFNNVVSNIRVGASAQNPLTWTNYQGYDPEASNFGNQSVGASVDNAAFPNSKRLFFHLAVDF